ncbi:MAG: PrsW family intramembrane metalloprotease [Anaerolineales bacterium]|nr:PrsW family intramembrane metalloprotease [Anaerolineales bacterium]
MTLALTIGIGIPLFILFIMLVFKLYSAQNIGWVSFCLVWGGFGCLASSQLNTYLLGKGAQIDALVIFLAPIIHQTFVSLGVFFVLNREKSDNLIEGAVYGWAAGLGFAAIDTIKYAMAADSMVMEAMTARSFATTLVYATAAAITGLVMTQFYFRHRANRVVILLSGLGAAIGYNALYNWLVNSQTDIVIPVIYGIGGLTLMSLYITGQLRMILVQLGVQKKRADGLLEIVIPIGVDLAAESNFQELLEKMLVEAKNFCNADAGTLYLKKNDSLEFAVVRNDTLKIAMGGTSGNEVTLPPVNLYDNDGGINKNNIAAYAALTGEIINIEDAYENREFDFSGTREFDQRTGYVSSSFLTIPLKDSEDKVQGVLQLLNALDTTKKTIIPFDQNLQQLMTSFSSLASAALEGYIQEQKLRSEIRQLKIEIDHAKRDKQVAEITDSSYFKELQQKAQELRDKGKGTSTLPLE